MLTWPGVDGRRFYGITRAQSFGRPADFPNASMPAVMLVFSWLEKRGMAVVTISLSCVDFGIDSALAYQRRPAGPPMVKAVPCKDSQVKLVVCIWAKICSITSSQVNSLRDLQMAIDDPKDLAASLRDCAVGVMRFGTGL